MKITFFSNFLNHHQIPFCNEMYNILGNTFRFVATEPIYLERLNLGYKDASKGYKYAVNSYESEENREYCLQLGYESDVVIIGSATEEFVAKRIKHNKLTFRYSERIFNKGGWQLLSPRLMIRCYQYHTKYRNKNLHMLCAGAYLIEDLKMVFAYPGKFWKWGYFPEVKIYEVNKLFEKKNKDIIKLLWVGRFLAWKRPEQAIEIAKRLKKDGYEFSLDIIGSGEQKNLIVSLIKKYHLEHLVRLLGTMSPDKVREHMEEANIYLFTSNRQEGWGAVLNEAMSSACAVVAAQSIGSVPFLIKNGKNGFIYRDNDIDMMYGYVKMLVENGDLRRKLGEQAYFTMRDVWNPKIAAKRIIAASEKLLNNEDILAMYDDGPCSKA
jgi:glycosyltransferase involved in cell wall biosynthesis